MVDEKNRVNDLDAKEWIKFTKSWFIHNPKPRKKQELLHPAKYPESMIQGFIEFFTKREQLVLDPFLGTGSTLVACEQSGRNGIGIELMKKYSDIAENRIKEEMQQTTLTDEKTTKQIVINDNCKNIEKIWNKNKFQNIDFVITSPPYGSMLKKKGLAQEKRAEKNLDTKYSEEKEDLGNVSDHNEFINQLVDIFVQIKKVLNDNKYLVIILQNYREGPEYKTLAWDFTHEMKKHFTLTGVKIWCQDNKTLYPYGYRYSYVPNVHHHYCLVFKKVVPKT